MINAMRWWVYKKLCIIAWIVCPQPQKDDLGIMWGYGLHKFKEKVDNLKLDETNVSLTAYTGNPANENFNSNVESRID